MEIFRRIAAVSLVIAFLFIVRTGDVRAAVTAIHDFDSATEGRNPYAKPLIINNVIYGTTWAGGSYSAGTVYKVNIDGTGFSTLYNIGGDCFDAAGDPGLINYGSVLYGSEVQCDYGDFNWEGSIYKLNTDGTGSAIVRDFVGGGSDAAKVYGEMLLDGTTLYGMSYQGGSSGTGTIFSIDVDGTGFTILHSFAGGASDGSYPKGSLIQSGTTLYGMTLSGGSSGIGTIFKIETNGTGFSLLHSFAGGGSDGSSPYGGLTLVGSTLYGVTNNGGDNNMGVIFKIDTDGTGFSLLHEFAGGVNDGQGPRDVDLLLVDSTLYGTTNNGGDGDFGTIFKIDTDGSNYEVVHEFVESTDGSGSLSGLTRNGVYLYGIAPNGGANGDGVLYRYTLPDTVLATLSSLNPPNNASINSRNVVITFTTDENASCRAALTDQSYDDMVDNFDCTGDGGTSHSCNVTDLGSDGTKNVYISCTDENGNKDTTATNEDITYTLRYQAPIVQEPPSLPQINFLDNPLI